MTNAQPNPRSDQQQSDTTPNRDRPAERSSDVTETNEALDDAFGENEANADLPPNADEPGSVRGSPD